MSMNAGGGSRNHQNRDRNQGRGADRSGQNRAGQGRSGARSSDDRRSDSQPRRDRDDQGYNSRRNDSSENGATAAKNVIMRAAVALVPAAVTDVVARAARIPAVAIEITAVSVRSLSEMAGEKPAVMSRAGNVTVAVSMSVTSVPLPLHSVPAAVMLPVP